MRQTKPGLRTVAHASRSLIVALCMFMPAHAGAKRFTIFTVAGSVDTYPMAINAGGEIAGFYRDGANHLHGFVRDPGGAITSFDVAGMPDTVAVAINEAGYVTGSTGPALSFTTAFLRAPDGTIETFLSPKNTYPTPTGINTHNVVVGRYSSPDGTTTYGFVRKPDGKIKTIKVAGAALTVLAGINDNGLMVGTVLDAQNRGHGFLQFPDGSQTLFDVSDSGPEGPLVTAVNNDGWVVGQSYQPTQVHYGFVRDPSGAITTFGARYTDVACINNHESITGMILKPNASHGFLFSQDGTFSRFDAPGVGPGLGQGTMPACINDAGVIVGSGVDANTHAFGFVRTP